MKKLFLDIRDYSNSSLEFMLKTWENYHNQIERGFCPIFPNLPFSYERIQEILQQRKQQENLNYDQ